jgi:threonyl-tRNA synthetase
LRNEKIGFKIREHSIQRVPYLLIIGDKEMDTQSVTLRNQQGEDLGNLLFSDLLERLNNEILGRK